MGTLILDWPAARVLLGETACLAAQWPHWRQRPWQQYRHRARERTWKPSWSCPWVLKPDLAVARSRPSAPVRPRKLMQEHKPTQPEDKSGSQFLNAHRRTRWQRSRWREDISLHRYIGIHTQIQKCTRAPAEGREEYLTVEKTISWGQRGVPDQWKSTPHTLLSPLEWEHWLQNPRLQEN